MSHFAVSHKLAASVHRGSYSFAAGLPLTQRAVDYAGRMHAGQRRSDGEPFILHPLEVAWLLHEQGAPDHLVAAGVVHDVLEKTEASVRDLRDQLGARIASLVQAVSDDGTIDRYASRKAALRSQVATAGDEALTLFAADKVSKLREFRREAEEDAGSRRIVGHLRGIRARRLRHYQRSLALLEEQLPHCRLVRELRAELRSYMRERARLSFQH